MGQPANRAQRIDGGAGEAIEAGDDDAAGLACLAAGECLLEHRPLELGTRLIDLLPPLYDFDVVQLCPLGDLLALDIGRDERLALAPGPPAHADVAVGRPRV